MDRWILVRSRGYSRQFHLKSLVVIAILLLVAALVAWLSLSLGKYNLSASELLQALDSRQIAGDAFIVQILRMPRLLMAFMVGGALAVAGLLLQTIVRNPLASPDVMGVTGGASAAAVWFMTVAATSVSALWLPLAAMSGGLAGGGLVYLLSRKNGLSSTRLILIGIGIAAIMTACTTLLLVFSPLSSAMSAYVWLTGSVYGARWHEVGYLALWLLPAMLALLWVARSLQVSELGEPLSTGLGVAVERMRLILLLLSVYLAGAAIAYAGALGFVGLISPHLARRLADRSGPERVIVTALVGSILVMSADLIGRVAFLPLDLPAGVFVSAVGAPYFLYLLLRARIS